MALDGTTPLPDDEGDLSLSPKPGSGTRNIKTSSLSPPGSRSPSARQPRGRRSGSSGGGRGGRGSGGRDSGVSKTASARVGAVDEDDDFASPPPSLAAISVPGGGGAGAAGARGRTNSKDAKFSNEKGGVVEGKGQGAGRGLGGGKSRRRRSPFSRSPVSKKSPSKLSPSGRSPAPSSAKGKGLAEAGAGTGAAAPQRQDTMGNGAAAVRGGLKRCDGGGEGVALAGGRGWRQRGFRGSEGLSPFVYVFACVFVCLSLFCVCFACVL